MSNPQADDAEAFYYALDNIKLTSVGIDIGSTTSHLMFSRVHLKRETERHSTRYVVAAQEVLWRSDIRFTPYLDHGQIDAAALGGWVDHDFAAAGLTRADLPGAAGRGDGKPHARSGRRGGGAGGRAAGARAG